MHYRYAVLPAPSALGLHVDGVARSPAVLLRHGLAQALGARVAPAVPAPAGSNQVDAGTGVFNAHEIAEYAHDLGAAIADSLDRDEFPVVLGGDCSILLGAMSAVRARGRYGLLFVDGHADFYQPEAEPTGEAASMELGFVTGRGPRLLTGPESLRPLVRDEDVLVVGFRDAELAASEGSRPLPPTIEALDLAAVRSRGASAVAKRIVDRFDAGRFWIHFDVDVLDDAVMPAVDYRQAGGLSWSELGRILDPALASGRAVGLDVTIFNPDLDADGAIGTELASRLPDLMSPYRADTRT
jgi:arginase